MPEILYIKFIKNLYICIYIYVYKFIYIYIFYILIYIFMKLINFICHLYKPYTMKRTLLN